MADVVDVPIGEPGTVVGGTSLPTANSNLLTSTTTVNKTGSITCQRQPLGLLRFKFTPSVPGVLSAVYTYAGTPTSVKLFAGATLQANIEQPGEVYVTAGESVNFQFSVTSGTFRLIVREY